MSAHNLYVSSSTVFGGVQKPFEDSHYVVIGVPIDATSSFRCGARFAPLAIREASLNIETHSFRSDIDLDDLAIHDLGDFHVSGKIEETLNHLAETTKELIEIHKTPILIGGEHTISLGAMRGIGGDETGIVSFDAHLDLRDSYMNLGTSHATFMRRLNEQVKPKRIVEVGTRAVCGEELAYATTAGIEYFTAEMIGEGKLEEAKEAVRKAVEDCQRIYLTIDMDVLDPAFAPAVQNPEPLGLQSQALVELVLSICDSRLVGLDLVEIAPKYDYGTTVICAAKILFEVLCHIEKTRQN